MATIRELCEHKNKIQEIQDERDRMVEIADSLKADRDAARRDAERYKAALEALVSWIDKSNMFGELPTRPDEESWNDFQERLFRAREALKGEARA